MSTVILEEEYGTSPLCLPCVLAHQVQAQIGAGQYAGRRRHLPSSVQQPGLGEDGRAQQIDTSRAPRAAAAEGCGLPTGHLSGASAPTEDLHRHRQVERDDIGQHDQSHPVPDRTLALVHIRPT